MEMRHRRLAMRIWDNRAFYLMLLPAVVLTVIFCYVPIYGITLAFKSYSLREGILGSPWATPLFKNFQDLFIFRDFWRAFRNTIEINLLKLAFGFVAPIILAIMLNAVRNNAMKRVFQTLVYMPHFVSWVVVAGLVFSLVDIDSGAVASLLRMITGKDVDVLSNWSAFRAMLVITDIWKETGWGAIIYLAALAGISTEYYEAARIDGANVIQQLRHITLPQLLPTINIMFILRLGGMVSGGFDQVYNLYNETVYQVADVLDTFTYRYGINDLNYEIGTAVSIFANLINITIMLAANKIIKLFGGEGLY